MKSTNFKLKSSPGKKSRKPLLILLVLILLLAIGSAIVFVRRNNANKLAEEQKAQSEAQTDSVKKDVENNTKIDDANTSAQTTVTSDQVPATTTYSLKISDVNQTNRTVNAMASVTGSSQGKCVFTYTNPDDKPVIQEITTTNGSCKSSISEVQFSKLGTWNLNVVFYANNTKAEANQSVTIN